MSLLTLRRRTTTEQQGQPTTPDDQRPLAQEEHGSDAALPSSAIGDVRWRQSVRIAGRVRSVRVRPWADVATLECTLVDDSGGITIVFLGRRKIPGIHPGCRLAVEGVAGDHHDRLAILNPVYLLQAPDR